MNSDFNNRDFERFVKQNADQYRMFPSEKVWEGVHAVLHKRRRRYGFALALLLISSAVITGIVLIPGTKNNSLAASQKENYLVRSTASTSSENKQPGAPAVMNQLISSDNNKDFTSSPSDKIQKVFNTDYVMDNPAGGNTTALVNDPAPSDPVTVTVSGITPAEKENSITGSKNILTAKDQLKNSGNSVSASQLLSSPQQPSALEAALSGSNKEKNNLPTQKPGEQLSNAGISNKAPEAKKENSSPVITKSSRKKLSWQLYLTPTVSYRSLSENLEYLSAARYNTIVNGSSSVAFPTDINTEVSHRPAAGFQLGLRAAYPVSNWFSFTGGIQLSVSKYNLKAYEHPAETAAIALRDRTVPAVSNYRNIKGSNTSWLNNYYFAASLPLGMELKLSDGDKNYFGIGGTVQPTYIIANRSYMLSADLKNYAEVPSLNRKWNMNTSFEIFSAHTTGKLKWRIGPQVRYQVMSSFKKNYPIKEHLVDFGLKLGIQLK